MTSRRSTRLLAVLAAGLLGCTPRQTAPPAVPPAPSEPAPAAASAPNPTPLSVRFGDLRINSNAGTYLATERGYFAEAGITVELEPFATGGEMIAPLANNQLDAGFGGIAAGLYNAFARGVAMKMVADMG